MPLQKNLCHPINYNTFFEGNTEFIKKKERAHNLILHWSMQNGQLENYGQQSTGMFKIVKHYIISRPLSVNELLGL